MTASNPLPTKKINPCPVCGDESGKCRTFADADRDLVLCMSSDRATGFKFLGRDKSGLWNKMVPDRELPYNPPPRMQAVPSSPPMAASDRQTWYENFLATKPLSDRDRADLAGRGLTADEIGTLPVASAEIGYAVVFRGVGGSFVGSQWRMAEPGDGARYRWQNLPGGKNHPAFPEELPLAIWECDRPRGLALVEGTGIKPYLAAKKLGMIAIGAAGGLHASAPGQMRAILQQYRNLPVVIVPDAGDIKNPHVMQRHGRTEAFLQDLKIKVKFLWWNQLTKDHDDVDEADEDVLDAARFVSLKAIANIQNDHAFNETLDQVDVLQEAISDPLQRDWVLQSFAVENGLKNKGFNGSTLAQIAQARRDAREDLDVVDAHDILDHEQAPKFLIGGHLLEGTVTVLGAIGGTGKTTLLYDFAKAIATGKPWSHHPVRQGRCLIVQTDEPKPNIKQKLQVAQFRDVPRGSVEFLTRFRFTQFEKLADRVRREKYAFVVIDSWTAAHAGTGIDLTKSSAGENAYLLRDLAEEVGCAIVVVHHLNKNGDLRDSSALFDNVSEVWKLTRGTPEQQLFKYQRMLIVEKSRSDLQGLYLLEQKPADYSWEDLGEWGLPDVSGSEPVISQVWAELKNGRSVSAYQMSQTIHQDYQKVEAALERLHRQGSLSARWIIHNDRGFWAYQLDGRPVDGRLDPISASEPEDEESIEATAAQAAMDLAEAFGSDLFRLKLEAIAASRKSNKALADLTIEYFRDVATPEAIEEMVEIGKQLRSRKKNSSASNKQKNPGGATDSDTCKVDASVGREFFADHDFGLLRVGDFVRVDLSEFEAKIRRSIEKEDGIPHGGTGMVVDLRRTATGFPIAVVDLTGIGARSCSVKYLRKDALCR